MHGKSPDHRRHQIPAPLFFCEAPSRVECERNVGIEPSAKSHPSRAKGDAKVQFNRLSFRGILELRKLGETLLKMGSRFWKGHVSERAPTSFQPERRGESRFVRR